MSNPYIKFVAEYERLLKEGAFLPLGGIPHPPRRTAQTGASKALVFSPHPDDECIVGALPLRLLREMNMNVINVAVTLGSRQDRRLGRLAELRAACEFLGFELLVANENGLEKINAATRESSATAWNMAVDVIATILAEQKPHVIFMPHAQDWNSSHIGTHFLLCDALQRLDMDFACLVCETEFWGAHPKPNLMIESSPADVADLVGAISFHVGEVQRNPYHLRLPAWMQDNVRRGGELVGGQGTAVPNFAFATLYHLRKWARQCFTEPLVNGVIISSSESPARFFG